MAGSLFDRLTTPDAWKSIDEDESIRLHLLRMLTTRQGAVQALPDYGLPDLNDLSFSRSDLIIHCCGAIKQCIEKYEPRLSAVEVSQAPTDDHFTMAFNISGMRRGVDGKMLPWRWAVEMDGAKIKRA